MEVKHGESVILLFFKINLSTTISMKRSRRELFIGVVIHRGISKNNNNNKIKKILSFPVLPSYLK